MIFKLACLQMNSGPDLEVNLSRMEAMVIEAAAQGAQLIGLPENVFSMQEHGAKRTLYTQDAHPGIAAAKQLAKSQQCWLLVGSAAVKIDESGKSVNRSLLINPQGAVAAQYDKIHLFDVNVGDGQTYLESSKILPGAKGVVASLPWGKLGLSVCYDLRFPHLYRALAKAGADILAVPAAFTQVTGEAHWHVLLRARAIENGCYVMAPAQCGTHPGGRKTYGHALIIDPWGRILADAGTEEGIIAAEIDMEQVARVRASIPCLRHDREFTL